MDLPTSATIAIRVNGGAETTKTIPINNVGLVNNDVILPGDVIVLAVPITDANTTGIYNWTATLTVNWDANGNLPARDYRSAFNGAVTIVRNDGPARVADGWAIDLVDRLVPQKDGVLWVTGTGDVRYFENNKSGSRFGDGTFISPTGEFGILVQNDDFTYTYTDSHQNRRRFDARGRLVEILDAHDLSALKFAYDDATNLLMKTTALDGAETLFNRANSYIVSITEPGGRLVRFERNTNTNWCLDRIVDPDGSARTFSYNGKLLLRDTWLPQITTFAFTGEVASSIQLGTSAASTYYLGTANLNGIGRGAKLQDPADRIATVTDPKQEVTTYRFDGYGRTALVTDPLGNWKQFDRDSVGRVLTYTDPIHIVNYHYDTRGNLDETQGEESDTSAIFDRKFNLPIRSTDARSFSTHYVLDTRMGDVLEERQPAVIIDGISTPVIVRNGWVNGLLTSSTNARGYSTIIVYDNRRRLQSTADPLGNVTSYTYDLRGNPESVEDPRKNKYITEYDANSRLETERFADGGVTRRNYSPSGLLSTIIYQNNSKSRYEYNTLGQLTTLTEAVDDAQSQRTTTFLYDLNGNLIEKTEGISPVAGYQHLVRTRYAYDAANRLTTIIEGYGSSVVRTKTRAYDAANRLISESDGRGIVTAYQYDSKDRVTVVTEDAGEGGSYFNRKTTTIYDAAGNILEVQKPEGRITKYAYDSHNRVTTLIEAVGSPVERTTSTEYNIGGNVRRTTDAMGVKTEYIYDRAGRRIVSIEAVGTALQRSRFYFYDVAGNLTERLDPVGLAGEQSWVSTYFAYDALNRNNYTLTGFKKYTGNPSVTLSAFANSATPVPAISLFTTLVSANAFSTTSRQFDLSGNILWEIDANNQKAAYRYDALNRTLGKYEGRGSVTSSVYSRATTMQYDATSNLIKRTTGIGAAYGPGATGPFNDPAGNPLETTFEFNALNQMTTMTQATNAVGTEFTHSLPVTQYSYDAAGNVEYITDPRGVATYLMYDRLNRLLMKQENVTAAYDTSSRFLWFSYDINDNLTWSYDGRGVGTQFVYDELNRKTTTLQGAFLPTGITLEGGPIVTSTEFDANDREIANTDGRQTVTRRAYDVLGRTIATIEAFGHPEARMTTFAYDQSDRLISQTTGLAVNPSIPVVVGVGMVDLGAPVQNTASLENPTSPYAKKSRTDYQVDDLGRITKETRAAHLSDTEALQQLGHYRPTTYYNYDSNGRLWYVSSAVDLPAVAPNAVYVFSYQQLEYDVLGRTKKVIDGSWSGAWNNQTGQYTGTYTPQKHSDYWYDVNGQVRSKTENVSDSSSITNASSTTAYEYDKLGRIKKQIEGFSRDEATTTEMQYDVSGNMTAMTRGISTITWYAHAVTTHFQYDAFGRQIRKIDAVGATDLTFTEFPSAATKTLLSPITEYAYDLSNNLVAIVDPRGIVTSLVYDAIGRRTETIFDASDGPGKDNRKYNPTTGTISNFGDPSPLFHVRYSGSTLSEKASFDSNGNIIETMNKSGFTTQYVYDRLGRKTQLVEDENGSEPRTSEFVYDAANNLTRLTAGLSYLVTVLKGD